MPWKHILVSHHPPQHSVTKVVLITINRPEKANAYTLGIEKEMIHALDLFDSDDRVRAIVVTGAGKYFCAGADLNIGLHREEGGKSKGHRDGLVCYYLLFFSSIFFFFLDFLFASHNVVTS
jgi:enoyl-CoA hydratase/carnithine racemase